MKQLSILALGLLGLWAFYSPPVVQASCVVEGTTTYAVGASLRDDKCDTSGAKKVTTGGAAGTAGGTANAAGPTLVEGTLYGFFMDLAGNLRVTLGTLLAGEDQTNNLLMTSGGAVRSTTMASAVTTNTTSAAAVLPVGSKSIYGSVTGTGAITQTQAIYGGITSGVTSTTGILLCTLTLSGTTAVYDACPVMTANFLFYIVVTTATTGTGSSGTVTGMY